MATQRTFTYTTDVVLRTEQLSDGSYRTTVSIPYPIEGAGPDWDICSMRSRSEDGDEKSLLEHAVSIWRMAINLGISRMFKPHDKEKR